MLRRSRIAFDFGRGMSPVLHLRTSEPRQRALLVRQQHQRLSRFGKVTALIMRLDGSDTVHMRCQNI